MFLRMCSGDNLIYPTVKRNTECAIRKGLANGI